MLENTPSYRSSWLCLNPFGFVNLLCLAGSLGLFGSLSSSDPTGYSSSPRSSLSLSGSLSSSSSMNSQSLAGLLRYLRPLICSLRLGFAA